MSCFRLRTAFSRFGRSLLCSAALISLAGLALAGPPAEASDCSGKEHPSAGSHLEWGSTAYSLALSGRYAYALSEYDGNGWPAFRFDVFDVCESARPASLPIFAHCVEVDGDLVYLGGGELRILDVSDPTAPRTLGTYPTQDVSGIAVDRAYAYLAGAAGLSVFDVSDPTSPTPLGNAATPEPARSVAVSGRYAYLAAGGAGLAVVDVSDPSSPRVVGTCVLPGPAWHVAVRGSRAYLADGAGLRVIDVSRPAEPRLIGGVDTPGDARRVALSAARAYVVDRNTTDFVVDGGLRVIDISNPAHPIIVNSIVDVPIMEGSCYERHAEPACIGVNRGRVAVAGAVVHRLAECDCVAGPFGCDYSTGYLDVTSASAYEPPPLRSTRAARTAGPPADAPAGTSDFTMLSTFVLRGSEPNPFGPETSIRFDVPRSSRVRIHIYDARGQLVQRVVDDVLPPGPHAVSWSGRRENGEAVPSGVYFVTMEAEDIRRAMKITRLR